MDGENPAETRRRIGEAARKESERRAQLMRRIEKATTEQLEGIVKFLDREIVALVNRRNA